MNFWKFLTALICGVTVWLIIDNPFTNFVEEKEKMLNELKLKKEPLEIEETFILKETTDSVGHIFEKRKKENFDDKDLNQKYDLYLGNCGNGDVKIAIIQSVLKTDMSQAKLFVESHNDTKVPFLTNLNILEAKAYRQAFTNAACDCKIDKSIY